MKTALAATLFTLATVATVSAQPAPDAAPQPYCCDPAPQPTTQPTTQPR